MADEIDNGADGAAQEPTYTPVEQQALEQGWRPKEEFSGDEHKWVPADEFIRRGELFSKIDSQNRRLKETEKEMAALKAHYAKVQETEYNRAIADLRKQKRAALEEGDADAVIAVEDAIDELKSKKVEVKEDPVADTQAPHPEFVAWTDKNTWYVNNTPMRAFADALGLELAQKGKSPSEVLREVEKQVREEFPQKFRNPNKDRSSAVESGDKTATSAGSGGSKKISLSEEETRIMNTLVKGGHITKEKYMADLQAVRERS